MIAIERNGLINSIDSKNTHAYQYPYEITIDGY